MKYLQSLFCLSLIVTLPVFLIGQTSDKNSDKQTMDRDFSDRHAVLKTIENFYIGDHTGSIEHKKLSMHEKGAYRYVNRNGAYVDSVFRPDSDDSDPNYKEELLSIEIYGRLAIARLRQEREGSKHIEYKVMTMHKFGDDWKITTISWGFGITH